MEFGHQVDIAGRLVGDQKVLRARDTLGLQPFRRAVRGLECGEPTRLPARRHGAARERIDLPWGAT